MSVLDALDATRLCARWSRPLADPAAWTVSPPTVARRVRPHVETAPYSWRSLLGNPHAMLMTGLVGAAVAKDALLSVVAPGAPAA